MILLLQLALIVVLVCLPVGALLIIHSRRRLRTHPICAGCGYDLSGHADAGAVCPECGQALDERGGIPMWQVRRDTRTRAVGISLVIVGFVLLTLVMIVLIDLYVVISRALSW